MTFGKRLRALREAQGLSPQEFGEMVGLAPQTISAYEIGTRHPNDEQIAAMIRALNCSAAYLILGDITA